jgi:hypothetical protein
MNLVADETMVMRQWDIAPDGQHLEWWLRACAVRACTPDKGDSEEMQGRACIMMRQRLKDAAETE